LQDVLLPLPPGVYNPSLVVYQGSAWLVARSTQLKWDSTGMKWILNRAHLCQLNSSNWSAMRCAKASTATCCCSHLAYGLVAVTGGCYWSFYVCVFVRVQCG
jgi:hypothetical protein